MGSEMCIRDRYLGPNGTPHIPSRAILGFNPIELASQLSAIGSIPGILQNFGQAQRNIGGTYNYINRLQNQALSSGVPGIRARSAFANNLNPYINQASQAVLNPITEALTQQILPNIRSSSIGAGQYGGSRQQLAEQGAVNSYIDRATQAISPLQSQLYNQLIGGDIAGSLQTQRLGAERGNELLQQATLGSSIIPRLAQTGTALGVQGGLLPSSILSSVGGQRRQLDQAALDSAYQSGLTNTFLPFSLASQVAGLGSGFPGGSTYSQSQLPGQSPFQSILGAAATILPFFF